MRSKEDLERALRETSRMAFVLQRIYPPQHNRPATSYLGGYPVLPPLFDWPRAANGDREYSNKPLAFVAQIDCTDLPDVEWNALPRVGILYFFVNTALDWYSPEQEPWGKVLYHPGTLDGLCPVRPPPDYYPYMGEAHFDQFPWLEVQGETADAFLRWPIEFLPIETFSMDRRLTVKPGAPHPRSLPLKESAEHDSFLKDARKPMLDSASANQPKLRAQSSNGPDVWPKAITQEGRIEFIPPFPIAWIQVEIVLQNIVRELHDLEEPTSEQGDLLQNVSQWLSRAREQGRFTPVSPAAAREFEDFLDRIVEVKLVMPVRSELKRFHLELAADRAIPEGVSACLAHSAESAALVQPDLIPLLTWHHSGVPGSMLGHADNIQGGAEQYEDHVLLLELGHRLIKAHPNA